MPPRKAALFGGSEKQAEEIAGFLPDAWELYAFSRSQEWPERLEFRPTLGLIFYTLSEGSAEQQFLRARRLCPRAPVVAIGQNPSRRAIIKLFRLGAADFLIYPFEKAEFEQALLRLAPLPFNPAQRIHRLFDKWFKGKLSRPAAKVAVSPPASVFQPTGLPAIQKPEGKVDAAQLETRLFNRLSLIFDGRECSQLPGKKANSLLAFMLFHHRRPIHREVLMDKFWRNVSPASARNSLNVAIHSIRKHFQEALNDELILYENDNYFLNPELNIVTDVERFLAYWQRGRSLDARQGLEVALEPYREAARLYTGELLEGLPYEEWCEPERDNLRETYLFILGRLNIYYFEKGAYYSSVHLCNRMLEKDPCLEDVHRTLITAYHRLGHRDKAIRQYYKCEQALREELEVFPSVQTRSIFESISSGEELGH